MKKNWLTVYFLFVSVCSFAGNVDSLKALYAAEKNDTARFVLCQLIVDAYQESAPETAKPYGLIMMQLAENLDWEMGKAISLNTVGYLNSLTGNYPAALQNFLKGIAIAEKNDFAKDDRSVNHLSKLAFSFSSKDINDYRFYIHYDLLHNLGNLYEGLESYELMLEAYQKAREVVSGSNLVYEKYEVAHSIGRAFLHLGKTEEAIKALLRSEVLSEKITYRRYLGFLYRDLGNAYLKTGNLPLALKNFRRGISEANHAQNVRAAYGPAIGLAYTWYLSGRYDSALHFAHMARQLSVTIGVPKGILGADTVLASIHKAGKNMDSAYFFLSEAAILKDRLMSADKIKQLQVITEQDNKRKSDIAAEKQAAANRMKLYAVIAILFFVVVFSAFLLRNNAQRKKINVTLLQQKTEVESALQKLKIAQTQLVQQEKLASLGELTAGIAHEIQNPLNFINNFSEVNAEMALELKEEISLSGLPETEKRSVLSLAENILQNQEKIVQHGKRADSIVKGMLQHSRTSTGKKEPVDINNLVDEYLRLSYHGLRAKDKSFNADMVTGYDPAVGSIPVLPQDLGRVFLNLFNNAFYAVTGKKKLAGQGYKPVVTVKTTKSEKGIEIEISDNGMGIPQSSFDKIFQPFFTTKPTGEGTGLGLSLSYDIITKGHGGKIEAETKEGEFAKFIIILPA